MEDPDNTELVCPHCGRARPSSLVRSFGGILRAAAENRCWLSDGSCKNRANKADVRMAGDSHLEDKAKNALRRYVAQTQNRSAMLGFHGSLAVAR